jgi:lysophospholipase L1-like esterase
MAVTKPRDVPAAPKDEAPAPTARSQGNGLRAPALGAMVTLAALVAVPYLVPGLERLRLLQPLPPGAGIVLAPPPAETAEVGEIELPAAEAGELDHLGVPEEVDIPAPARELYPAAKPGEKPPVSIEGAAALDAFFAKLAKVERGDAGAIARIAAWGDSNVASDLVTGVLRRALQERFGDAGHGYVLLTRTSKRYFHNDVRQIAASGWGVSDLKGPLAADSLYGIGATSFRALGSGAFAKIGTTKKGTFGRKVSRFVVDYLAHPEGDGIEVLIDGEKQPPISTVADAPRGATATFTVPDGEHEIEIRSLGKHTRVFGLWLERDGPGVVLDTLGVTGCKIRYLLRIEPSFFAAQLKTRDPDLLLFNFGVNEAREGEALMGGLDNFEKTMREVLGNLRRDLPGKGCLVVSPSDTAVTMGDMKTSYPLLAPLVEIQQRVARDSGCAFWNMREAMGGDGSMGRWMEKMLGEEDGLHPSKAGATLLGQWLYLALMERYAEYLARMGRE